MGTVTKVISESAININLLLRKRGESLPFEKGGQEGFMNIKSLIRRSLAGAYYYAGLYRRAHRGKVLILAYHRVLADDDPKGAVQPGMYVNRSVFERQVAFLKTEYEVISFNTLLQFWENRTFDLRKKYCVVTFDDGWLDNYRHAYPVLKKYRLPATIFLPTAYIGTNRWFWPDSFAYFLGRDRLTHLDAEARKRLFDLLRNFSGAIPSADDNLFSVDALNKLIESLKGRSPEDLEKLIQEISGVLSQPLPSERVFLNWEEVREMSRHGISFGSHSSNHLILTGLPSGRIRHELEGSQRILKEKGLNYLPVFCYPNGNSSEAVRKAVREAGYRAAVGGAGLEEIRPKDIFNIRRIGVHNDISRTVPLFSWHVSDLRRKLKPVI